MDRGLDVFRAACLTCGHTAHLRRVCYHANCDCLEYWADDGQRPPPVPAEVVAVDGVPTSPAPALQLTEHEDLEGDLLEFQIERGEDLDSYD